MRVIGCGVEEALKGCFLMDDATGKAINQVNGSEKGFVPKFEGHTRMG
jgi:hypothetical protein